MAKGITKEDVEKAIYTIESRGDRTTHDSVRRELGDTGSMATINKHIKAIQSQRASQHTKRMDLPDDLSNAISQSVSALWEQAQQIARRDIEAIRSAALERTDTLQKEIDAMCTSFDEQAVLLAKTQSELERSLVRLEEVERALLVAETEKAELEKHNAALLSRLDSQAAVIDTLISQISVNVCRKDASDANDTGRDIGATQKD